MAKLDIKVPHVLEREEVFSRLRKFSSKVHEQLGNQVSSIDEEWDDENESMEFSVKAKGMSIKGNMAVHDDTVDVHSNLPFAALPFRGMIESFIRNAIEQVLVDSPSQSN